MRYPGNLDAAVAAWLAGQGGSLRQGTTSLRDRYGKGGNSAGLDLAAYLATRLPATFAVNQAVLAEVARLVPPFQPHSVLDVGAGPGTASWAALAVWQNLAFVRQVEVMAPFRDLSMALNAKSAIPALEAATIVAGDVRTMQEHQSDLVLASYVLAELPEADAGRLGLLLWARAAKALVVIEPGTPTGFARIRRVRDAILAKGGHVLGPCTHNLGCPMAGSDWCHFKERVQRSRAHMHAKGAIVPFEDEPFSWIALAREPVPLSGGRILAPPEVSKIDVALRVCTEGRVEAVRIASRDRDEYKLAKKRGWGDVFVASRHGSSS